MKKLFIISLLATIVVFSVSFSKESLRSVYSKPPAQWPKPTIDEGVKWTELGILPESPLGKKKDSLKHIIELGKALFFDTKLSGSGKISCATCHQPELNWTDGKQRSIGHEGAVNKRNAPTIQNTWFYNKLFWDGRAKDLQDQAFAPINSESEMHNEMYEVMRTLSKVKGYKNLFSKAFGDDDIDPFRLTEAIAVFEKTIVSNKSRFDEFLEGNKNALTNSEIRGLHVFRTTARCMNCHNGPMFSDNQFHNNGFHLYGDQKDYGLYNVTHNEADMGKFKTPSLRDVMNTGPWMHNGMMQSMESVLGKYRKGHDAIMGGDILIHRFSLTRKQQNDLLAFLKAISAPPVPFIKPIIPQ